MSSTKFTALGVKSIKTPGYYSDPEHRGLYLQVCQGAQNVSRSWIFRYTSPITGKRREMGLGPLNDRPLSEARRKAAECRALLLDGVDPLDAVQEQREAKRLANALTVTFREASERCITAKKAEWTNDKHRSQWVSTLTTYAYPVLADVPVQNISTGMILKVLEPIWTTKTETATRVRQRMETILDWCKARGYLKGDNPARYAGHLSELLPRPEKIKTVRHHPALPYTKIYEFIQALRKQQGVAPFALEFLVQTTTRTSEVIEAKWDEIDLSAGVWTIPGERMKVGKPHRVPLNRRAIEILEAVQPHQRGGYVFPSPRTTVTAPLSNNALRAVMKKLPDYDQYVPHGFRSTFRDWASDQTGYANETVELALAHTIKNKAEAAYRREDQIEKRSRLMADWGRYIDSKPSKNRDNIVPLKAEG